MPLLPQSLWPRCTAPASATVPAPALTAAVYLVWLPAKRNWRGDEASLQAVLPVVYAQLEGMQVCVWGGGGPAACVRACSVCCTQPLHACTSCHACSAGCMPVGAYCMRACMQAGDACAAPGCLPRLPCPVHHPPTPPCTHPRPPAPHTTHPAQTNDLSTLLWAMGRLRISPADDVRELLYDKQVRGRGGGLCCVCCDLPWRPRRAPPHPCCRALVPPPVTRRPPPPTPGPRTRGRPGCKDFKVG